MTLKIQFVLLSFFPKDIAKMKNTKHLKHTISHFLWSTWCMSEWYTATKHGRQLMMEASCPLTTCVVAYGTCECATYIDREGKYYNFAIKNHESLLNLYFLFLFFWGKMNHMICRVFPIGSKVYIAPITLKWKWLYLD